MSRSRHPLRGFFRVLFRHKFKSLAFFVLVVGGVSAYTLFGPRTYRSEAKLFVRLGRESVTLDPTATTGQVVAVTESRESEMNSIYEMLQNRQLFEEVVNDLGPAVVLGLAPAVPAPPETQIIDVATTAETAPAPTARVRLASAVDALKQGVATLASLGETRTIDPDAQLVDRAVRQLSTSLKVSAVRKSSIVAIASDAPSPELAQRVAQSLIDHYLDQHGKMNRIQGSHDFFVEQSKLLADELKTREEALRDLKTKYNIGSIDTQRELLLRRLADTEIGLRQAEAEIASTEAHIAASRDKLSDLPAMLVKEETTGHANSAADEMRNQLYGLQLKEAELLTKYQEDYYLVQNIRNQIKEAKTILDRESDPRTQVTRSTNRLHEDLQSTLLIGQTELARVKAKAAALSDQLANGRHELHQLNGYDVQIREAQRELDLQEAKYRKYADNLEQARIDEALETNRISNINVVQAPSFSLKPVRPKKLMNLALGLALGLLGAIGLAFFAEELDPTVTTPEAAEELYGAPHLATLPHSRQLVRTLVARGQGRV